MKIFSFCRTYLFAHKFLLAIYILLTLFATAIGMFSPFIIGDFLDNLITVGTFDVVIRFCIIFATISLLGLFIGYINAIMYVKLQANMGYQLNKDTIDHVQNLSLSYTNQTDSAYLSKRINTDSSELITFCISILQSIISNSIMIIVPFIIMITINWLISLFLIGFLILYVVLYLASKNILYRTNYILKEHKDTFFSNLYDQLKYVRFIKLNGIDLVNKLDTIFKRLLDKVIKSQKVNYIVYGLDNTISTLAQIMLFVVGGMQILNGNFTVGMFIMFSMYFSMVLGAMSYFFNVGTSYQNALVAHNRMSDIFANKIESVGIGDIDDINKITMTNVSLERDNKKIVNAFNATFEKGNIYALVGQNGTGKSTIVNLIMGMYVNEKQGEIRYNNININELNMLELRKSKLAFAEQEPTLINDTIRYNITLSNEDNKDIKVLDYVKLLGVEDFINKSTLDLLMDEKNTNTSGGEKQKIAILRTLYKDTSVMIFDEPTSALDTRAIEKFMGHLAKIKGQKIIIIVTHDEYVKSRCDLVISVV